MSGTHVRRRPSHAANPWRLVPDVPRYALRHWVALLTVGALVVLAALGPLMVYR